MTKELATKGLMRKTLPMPWFTYILECSDGSYYVGITNDLQARVDRHNTGDAASWTRMRRPVTLRFAQSFPDKSAARIREMEIKDWRREKKEALFTSVCNSLIRMSAAP